MAAIDVNYIEMPITHICSLHCDGCTAYANYGIKNTVNIEDGRIWLEQWSRKITPKYFRILGGEPMLHPSLPEYIRAVREYWPACHINLTINGMNIDRHPFLPAVLAAAGNTSVHLSVHSRSEPYLARLQKAMRALETWKTQFGIAVSFTNNIEQWQRFYVGSGENMLPFNDNNCTESWRICISKTCLNIANNRLWKCPQIGNLQFIMDRFHLRDKPEWEPYVSYNGIGLDCNQHTLADFLARGPEHICGMCPDKWNSYEKDIYNTNFDLPDVARAEQHAC